MHAECDDAIDNLMLERVRNEEQVDYMCSVCRNRDPEVSQQVLVVWIGSFVFTMWHISVFFDINLQLDTVFPPFNFPSHEEPSNDMHVFDIKGKFAYIKYMYIV